MATAKRKPQQAAMDPDPLINAARALLKEEGWVKLAKLGPAGVRPAIVAALVSEGFEVTKSALRRPLDEQLARVLADGAFIALKSIGAHVVGASAVEAKRGAATLVAKGRAKLVLRGTEQVLVPSTTPVVSREEMARLARISKDVAKIAASKTEVSMLRSDLIEALRDAVPALAASRNEERAAVAPQREKERLATLLSAIHETRDPRTGLSFVPAIVAKLSPSLGSDATSALLVEAATEGVIELRPEGGLGRLSEQELAVCPPGPQGTRLSWARRTELEAR